MATYSEIKAVLDEIAGETSKNQKLTASSRVRLVTAQTNLASMPGKYGSIISDIDQAAIDNPNDDAYQLAKSEKDKLVVDFQALKSYVDNLIAAFDSVSG